MTNPYSERRESFYERCYLTALVTAFLSASALVFNLLMMAPVDSSVMSLLGLMLGGCLTLSVTMVFEPLGSLALIVGCLAAAAGVAALRIYEVLSTGWIFGLCGSIVILSCAVMWLMFRLPFERATR